MAKRPLKTLNEVLAVLEQPPVLQDKAISGLTLDSRQLIGGELFIAIPGFAVDGRQYISAAIAAGAAAILVEKRVEKRAKKETDSNGQDLIKVDDSDVPVIFISGLKDRIGFLADQFYRRPSETLNVIGVTGTNGKTTCCWFIAQMMSFLGQSCAVMGTIGKGIINKGTPELEPCLNTTSDGISLHQYMAGLVDQNVKAMAMEVSSHGLDQKRVDGVAFDIGVFTNISRDHLDYHHTLDAYAKAKSLLFADGRVKRAVINLDDDYSAMMLSACSGSTNVITFSAKNDRADVFAESVQLNANGLVCHVHTPWGTGWLRTPQLGRFNLENLLAVLSAICTQGFSLEKVLPLIVELTTVPGRMQRFGGHDKPLVVVDYAHTPDALESVLGALREHGAERLTCLFGCGGDRDRGKRPLMTQAAVTGADKVVVTSDNPRSEDPASIIADAISKLDCGVTRVKTIEDRSEAIANTVAEAVVGEIVVVAGKGHEDYQEVQGKRLPFDDREHVVQALANWRFK